MVLILFCGVLFFSLDQWTKAIAAEHLIHAPVRVAGMIAIRRVVHQRALYRLRRARLWMVLMWLFALGCATWLHYSGVWFRTPLALSGLGFALGGAAGNLVDILRRQSVIDIIDLGWWPVFNLADIGIVGGLLLAFCT